MGPGGGWLSKPLARERNQSLEDVEGWGFIRLGLYSLIYCHRCFRKASLPQSSNRRPKYSRVQATNSFQGPTPRCGEQRSPWGTQL